MYALRLTRSTTALLRLEIAPSPPQQTTYGDSRESMANEVSSSIPDGLRTSFPGGKA
ncbi:hypothetical protein PHO31112_00872 [Pandoraea horticolens]|uniref:Uncharacterized protein n=1 Tax=Pandoraea horticolens TaxID=2508298 RepID=A0A5E4SKT8_9BURK|nr:hypothetical protein PHO31112_00872 [Pandoraea horticolens]